MVANSSIDIRSSAGRVVHTSAAGREASATVKVLRQKYDYPIFLNPDHTHSLVSAEDAARAGFDSIVFDRSGLPFAQNISEAKRAVEVLKAINPCVPDRGRDRRNRNRFRNL